MWTTAFYKQKANFEHAIRCKDDIAYPHCGQANPKHQDLMIFSSDSLSPPAMQTTLHYNPPVLSELDMEASSKACQNAIAYLPKPLISCPDIGSTIQSM
jgi:hypothetical protein